MRGSDERSGSLFSYVYLEAWVRPDHPLRLIREISNTALCSVSEDLSALYPPRLGRPSIPPERLLRAMLLQAFYGLRSERQLMERMEFDLLFRWFVGLGVDDAQELVEHCTAKLARFKVPRHVLFMKSSDVPLTVTGRPQKFRLAQIAAGRLG